MKELIKRLRGAAPALARDAIGLAGAAAIVTGVGMIAIAAAWIVGGLMLIAAAIALSLKTG